MIENSYVMKSVDNKFVFIDTVLRIGARTELLLDKKWFRGQVGFNSIRGHYFYFYKLI